MTKATIKIRPSLIVFLSILLVMLTAGSTLADKIHVAIAANFTAPAKEIATAFEAKTGYVAILSFGSTGKLYTQIALGAPFEVFIAADQIHPEKAISEGLAVATSEFTYAFGTLVLYGLDKTRIDPMGDILHYPERFGKIAIANPKTAPYGVAAIETMKSLGVYDLLKSKIVRGDNITQAFQFVATGNADLGFVAFSQAIARKNGSLWQPPPNLYQPIAQDAVLLNRGKNNDAAKSFLSFLKGEEARKIIEAYGYRIE